MKEITPVRLQVDGEYAILYIGGERAANLPNATFRRTNMLEFHVSGTPAYRSYIDSITVAVGLDPLYETLRDTGSFTTRGIYFDVGSATIRPESTPTLVQLEETLTKHGELRVRIEGHTDSTGTDGYNMGLSIRRAEAVQHYLVSKGIAVNRLEIAGFGERVPLASNATREGRAMNRRVEFIVR